MQEFKIRSVFEIEFKRSLLARLVFQQSHDFPNVVTI